jgi:predicted nucleic acid-binding Zn ribbon protein
MPFYTFKCPSCCKEENILQGMDKPIPICQKCTDASCGVHLPKMKRQYTNSGGFKLKGDGWFKDGYTKSDKPK